MRGRVTQTSEHWAQRRRSSHRVNESDCRIDVARVGKKDARKSSGQVGNECGRVTGGIDRVKCLLERRKEVQLRERVGERTAIAVTYFCRDHLYTRHSLRRYRASTL